MVHSGDPGRRLIVRDLPDGDAGQGVCTRLRARLPLGVYHALAQKSAWPSRAAEVSRLPALCDRLQLGLRVKCSFIMKLHFTDRWVGLFV